MLKKIEQMLDHEPEQDWIQKNLDSEPFVDEYKSKIVMITLSLLAALISIGVFYVFAKKIRTPELLFVPIQGEVYHINSMILPNQSKEAVKSWAREAVEKTYTFDFRNVGKSLTEAEPYFTHDAWPIFKKTLTNSQLIASVEKNKLEVNVVAQIDPQIEFSAIDKSSKDKEEFAWKLIIPVTLSFSGDIPTENQDMIIRVTIVRVPTVENPKGLGVVQMSVTPALQANK